MFYTILTCILFCDLEGLKKFLTDWLEMKLFILTDSLQEAVTPTSILLPNVSLRLWCIDFEALLTMLAVCPEPKCPV